MRKGFLILAIFLVILATGFSLIHASVGPPAPTLTLENPLGDHETIPDILEAILKYLVIIAAPLFVIMVIIGAIQMLFAVGETEKFKRGKKTVIYSIIAYAIIIMATALTSIINNLIL